jgi:hypothetical protein
MTNDILGQTTSNSQPSAKTHAFKRFTNKLQEAGMTEESISFLSGKLFFAVNQGVIVELIQAGATEDELKKLDGMEKDEDKLLELDSLATKHAHKSIADLFEEVSEKLVSDFEAAGLED